MVFYNAVTQPVSHPAYANEEFRARHGYKEVEAHDPPYRRSRDFKPVPYGSFRGMLNYRHSEPYMLLKNMKDIANEDHQHPIKWSKFALKGAILGGTFGLLKIVGGDQGAFELNKLIAAGGNRNFSGNYWR